ncbi:hypothetical protein BJY24_000782 [Nocardia transvalensis]|uniref:Uncharacterized protein n=1 Tax=Nocardia transvalensis TaxID=37333 RepID=A0A7W9P9K2_9NOCA|nr:hypothetical protein [Nocardia transvalensis]MBB5911915.1 hypothetical protein [Nocardia transvalensis]
MRTFVHLVLFACAIAIAVGAFGPLVGSVDARDVRLIDLRDGVPSGWTLDQLSAQAASIHTSLTLLFLVIAAVILLAALFGSRALGWLGVIAGLAALGVTTWRLDQRFDDLLRDDYRNLLNGAWGLYLIGGGLVMALLALLVPRERKSL